MLQYGPDLDNDDDDGSSPRLTDDERGGFDLGGLSGGIVLTPEWHYAWRRYVRVPYRQTHLKPLFKIYIFPHTE